MPKKPKQKPWYKKPYFIILALALIAISLTASLLTLTGKPIDGEEAAESAAAEEVIEASDAEAASPALKGEGEFCGSDDSLCESGLKCDYRCYDDSREYNDYCTTDAGCCNTHSKCKPDWECGDKVYGVDNSDEYGYDMGVMGYCVPKPTSSEPTTPAETPSETPPAAPSEPTKANGEDCNSDTQCSSNNCENFICCMSGTKCCASDTDCPSGWECGDSYYCVVATSDTGGACGSTNGVYPTELSLGSSSGKCAITGSGQFFKFYIPVKQTVTVNPQFTGCERTRRIAIYQSEKPYGSEFKYENDEPHIIEYELAKGWWSVSLGCLRDGTYDLAVTGGGAEETTTAPLSEETTTTDTTTPSSEETTTSDTTTESEETTTTSTSTPSTTPSATTFSSSQSTPSSTSTRTTFITQKVEPKPKTQAKLFVGTPDENKLTLHRTEEYNLRAIVENTGTEPLTMVYYDISSDSSSTAEAVLAGADSTGTRPLMFAPLKPGEEADLNAMFTDKISAKTAGTAKLTFEFKYGDASQTTGYKETVAVDVTVLDAHVEKHEEGSTVFKRDCLKDETKTATLRPDFEAETSKEITFVRPEEGVDLNWQKANAEFNHYSGQLTGDVAGIVPGLGEGMDIAAIASTTTPDETLAATARAITPDAIEIGYDLAASAKAFKEREKWEKGILRANIGGKLANVKVDGVLWRVLYKEEGGKTYAIKLGRVFEK